METRLSFTTQRLEKLTCPDGKDRVYVYDVQVPGLALCVTAAGTKTFVVYRRVNGRPVRCRLGAWPHELGLDAARKAALKANGQIASGEDPRRAKRERTAEATFGELWTMHLERAKQRNKTWKENERQYNRHLKHWKARRLSEITRADVQALHAKLGQESGPYMANRVLALVHHMFERTALDLGWTKGNPAHGIDKFPEESRERFLRGDELPKFFQAIDGEEEQFADFFRLLLFTGARRSNVQAMAWDDVHLGRAEWRIGMTKNGTPVTITLSPEAVAILARRQAVHNGSPYVFPSWGKSGHIEEPKIAWKRVLKRAGIAGLRLHDLRRTLGSWQAATGASLPVIGKSLGHKSQQSTVVYARLDLDPVRASVAKATAAMAAAGKKGADQ